MIDRWSPRAPLTGLVFVVLVIVGGPVLAGSTPKSGATAAKVISFYTAHRDRERAAAIVLAFAFVAFLFFAATLRARWRRAGAPEGVTALLLAAAGVLVVGESVSAGLSYALGDDPTRLGAAAAQTLNLLANDLVITSAIGFFAFGVGAGLSILAGVGLPRWLGFSALGLAILFVLPPIEFVGFLLLLIWVAIVSVMVYRHADRSGSTSGLRPDPTPRSGNVPV